MGRKDKLKLENMRKANELLDKGHIEKYPTKEQVVLNPSDNVTNASKSFVNKMNNLNEEEDLGGMTSDPRIMAREYGENQNLSPAQQKLHDEVMNYIGQTFATWMSPSSRVGDQFTKNPPFGQEYAKPPYFDRLSNGIRDVIITNAIE